MDVSLLLQHSQYALPVGIVLVCAILVFVFGFKKAEQPPFAQLSVGSDVDRKFANKKRSKIKEKRSANGQVATEKASPIKKTVLTKTDASKKAVPKSDEIEGKLKERKPEDNKISVAKKEKEKVVTKVGKENKVEQVKNKKNLKNLFQEKPVDFDEGDWEQAYSRKDKKNKKKEEESPSKKNKRSTKKSDLINEEVTKEKVPEKTEIKNKFVKETENKELKQKEKEDVILTPISTEEINKEKEEEKEQPKNEKVEIVEKEEKKSGKPKKAKKVSESENISAVTSSIPKIDDKVQEQRMKKGDDSKEKESDPVEGKGSTNIEAQEKAVAAFDELGDVWTEAKPQKKSKKKGRKDN